MTDDDHQDDRDPIAAAFEDYQRAPADVVPKKPWDGDYEAVIDLANQTVELTHLDIETGRMVTERVGLSHPCFGNLERKN